jgi:hypothetical protein
MPALTGSLLRHQSNLASAGSSLSARRSTRVASVGVAPAVLPTSAPGPAPQTRAAQSGRVQRGSNHGLSSPNNQAIHQLLTYAGLSQAREPSAGDGIVIGKRTELALHVDANQEGQLAEILGLLHPTDPNDKDADPPHSGLIIGLLTKVVENGEAALTAGGEDGGVLKFMISSACPTARSDNPELQRRVQVQLDNNPALRLRLGAQALLQRATRKDFAPVGLGLSVGVSAGLGSAWELAMAEKVKRTWFGEEFSPTREAFKLAGVDCIPAPVIEGLDTACVLSILRVMRGQKAFSKDQIPTAISAGFMSGVMAYPNNLMQYKEIASTSAKYLVKMLTSNLAIWGAASGVPMDAAESEVEVREALAQQIENGFLAVPEGETAADFAARLANEVMNISPDGSIAQKSLGLASMVALIPVALEAVGVPESVLRILRSTIFQPIEAIAMNALAAWAKTPVPMPQQWRNLAHTSDVQRNEALTAKLFENARAGTPGRDDGTVAALESGTVNQVLAPSNEALRHMGKGVMKVMTPVSWVGAKMSAGMEYGGAAAVGAVRAAAGGVKSVVNYAAECVGQAPAADTAPSVDSDAAQADGAHPSTETRVL